MRFLTIAGFLALVACHGPSPSMTDAAANDTATIARKGADAAGGVADCSSKPDFAPVYPGGVISICNAAQIGSASKHAGSVLYTTTASPAEVLAYAKEETAKSGLAPRLSTNNMFSAGEGLKRTMMTHVEVRDGTTHVVLNWGTSD